MALGTITASAPVGQDGGPISVAHLSFAGDGAYPTGGTAAFEASVRTALGKGDVDILAVIPGPCGGYIPAYDRANDKLVVYEAAADGNPLDEVTDTTNLSGTTFTMTIVAR